MHIVTGLGQRQVQGGAAATGALCLAHGQPRPSLTSHNALADAAAPERVRKGQPAGSAPEHY